MIAVDTNVVVRLLTGDDKDQHLRAYETFRKEDVFIPTTVALETEWVLRYAYEFRPDEIVRALRKLFGLPNVDVEEPLRMAKALDWHVKGMDFADALHLTASDQCEEFITFDKKLIRKAKDIKELRVNQP